MANFRGARWMAITLPLCRGRALSKIYGTGWTHACAENVCLSLYPVEGSMADSTGEGTVGARRPCCNCLFFQGQLGASAGAYP